MKIFITCVVLFLLAVCLVGKTDAIDMGFGQGEPGMGVGPRPGPFLLYPATDTIDLVGKKDIGFRWQRVNLFYTDHYIFRLFKGYQTVTSTLILKKEYSTKELPIKLPASMFEEGQVYTWGLQQVFLNGAKTEQTFASFTIMKK